MMCKVLLQGLKEAVSRKHHLRECQFRETIKGKRGEAGEGLGAPKPREDGEGRLILSPPGLCDTPKPAARH